MNWLPPNRRSILRSLAALPGLGMLASSKGDAAVRVGGGGRDVIRELGVRPFINAGGAYTVLTASLMHREVWDAMTVASRQFCPLQDLHDAVGKRIAELTKNEAALVSAGAASAVAIGTAACVAGTDREKIRRLPDTRGMKNEVIIQKSHRNGYDHAARNTGIRLVEVETAEELESAIHSRTAMMLFLNMYKYDGKISHEEFAQLGKKHNVPTLVDAADALPPVENLWDYTDVGFDLAAFSGGKGIMGPQSAGKSAGKSRFLTRTLMGRVGRAAVKALYARQCAPGHVLKLSPALEAALWALLDIVCGAQPREVHLVRPRSRCPMVYADAFVKVGEKTWRLEEAYDEYCARNHPGSEGIEENGIGLVLFPGKDGRAPLYFYGKAPRDLLEAFAPAGQFIFVSEALAQGLVLWIFWPFLQGPYWSFVDNAAAQWALTKGAAQL